MLARAPQAEQPGGHPRNFFFENRALQMQGKPGLPHAAIPIYDYRPDTRLRLPQKRNNLLNFFFPINKFFRIIRGG